MPNSYPGDDFHLIKGVIHLLFKRFSEGQRSGYPSTLQGSCIIPQLWVFMPLVRSFHQGRLKIIHVLKYKIYLKEAKEIT